MNPNDNMELAIIRFKHSGRFCTMPLIINYSDLKKRQLENKILNDIVTRLEKAEGITEVQLLGGGIETFSNLEEEFKKIANLNEHKISFLSIQKRLFFEKIKIDNYGSTLYTRVNTKPYLDLPVRIVDMYTSADFIGDLPLPVLYIDTFKDY